MNGSEVIVDEGDLVLRTLDDPLRLQRESGADRRLPWRLIGDLGQKENEECNRCVNHNLLQDAPPKSDKRDRALRIYAKNGKQLGRLGSSMRGS